MKQKLAALRSTLDQIKRTKTPFGKVELAERAVEQAYSITEQQVTEYEALVARVRRLEGQS